MSGAVQGGGQLSSAPEQKTMFAQPAPVIPNLGAMGQGSASRTQALDAPAGGGGGINSTIFSPGPATGMTISPQALVIRQQVNASRPQRPRPAKPLFWLSFTLFGVCLGMLLHILWAR
jgi:hypothetical protein